ncbi:two component transcriptional regulator, LuxR family [Mycolicibacterium rutilum]|uniref:Two component transcriptional regulator, LuxR family n=1 Tax=Mycolicibacterium rutilum TaxID=370526 RepID=A0A1H6JBI6_MYCRU|nr:two component transcriptional regulator, LuxR family [Mycolicibacterium rutilum]
MTQECGIGASRSVDRLGDERVESRVHRSGERLLCEADRVVDRVTVVVGDDHPMFRDGVVRALVNSGQIDVLAEADDGVSALAAIRAHNPQVALLDYRMPGMDGAEVAAAVTRDELPTRVLLVSAHDEAAIVYQALQNGAAGFLPKESSRSELVNAVLDCAKGRDVVAPSLAAGLAGEIRKRAEPEGPVLSPREREVLKLIAEGISIPAMAKQLFLAPSTVKTHVQRLYEKLGVNDRGAAVAEAMRRKLLD